MVTGAHPVAGSERGATTGEDGKDKVAPEGANNGQYRLQQRHCGVRELVVPRWWIAITLELVTDEGDLAELIVGGVLAIGEEDPWQTRRSSEEERSVRESKSKDEVIGVEDLVAVAEFDRIHGPSCFTRARVCSSSPSLDDSVANFDHLHGWRR